MGGRGQGSPSGDLLFDGIDPLIPELSRCSWGASINNTRLRPVPGASGDFIGVLNSARPGTWEKLQKLGAATARGLLVSNSRLKSAHRLTPWLSRPSV